MYDPGPVAVNAADAILTTAQLAERTGIAAPTLRVWESRHGFPEPLREAGGHRRYRSADVELVRAVVALRGEGLSLPAAIARASAANTRPPSIFAGLVQQRPDLSPMRVGKPAMIEMSRALEDEYCAQAGGGILVGSFQRVCFYRQSERRWKDFARTSTVAVALADFKRLRVRPRAPIEVPVAAEHPLAREWTIIFHHPAASGCLAAWEIPVEGAAVTRRFEAVWSPDPAVALHGIALAASLVQPVAPIAASRLREAVGDTGASVPVSPRAVVTQAQRIISYLAGESARSL